jgi:hypothetical protein
VFNAGPPPHDQGTSVFAWRGGRAYWDSWGLGPPTVSYVLGAVVGVPSFKVEMPLKDRLRPLPGEWVLRKEATEDQRMADLARVLRNELKWKVRFEKRAAEHDVIVATGTFKPPPPTGKSTLPGTIAVFVDGKPDNGMAAGDLPTLVRTLGELCATETILEATFDPKASCFWSVHTGTNLRPEQADKMLANVAAQTGLRFARAKRVTTHWVAVAGE